jgi:hypothetical protein
MGFRDDLRALAYSVRSIPGQLEMRPYSVAIRTGTWSGTYTGRGTGVSVDNPITEANGQNPKVRFLNGEEIALGQLDSGAVEIGPVTPSFPGGGTDLSELLPALADGQTLHVVLTGPKFPDGALFRITDIRTDRAFHYMITAQPVANAT